MKIKTVALSAFLLTAPALLAEPFVVTPTTDATQLASLLLGSGVTLVGTPVLSGQPGQAGTFVDFTSGPFTNPITGTSGTVSLPSGVILSTGRVADAASVFDGGADIDMNGGSDADLVALLGGGVSVFDAASLTFQFQSTSSQTLYFTFAFASTEYPNFVNSQYNDVFAFLLNGENIALVPGTTSPIAVNTVNVGEMPGNTDPSNPAYFTQYSVEGVTPFNYGGVTQLFNVAAPLVAGTNTIKFAIGDVADSILDSAVLIQAGTFSTAPPNGFPPPNGAEIPEPSTYMLFGTGLGLLAWATRRRRNRS
jgi:hypothetical protein